MKQANDFGNGRDVADIRSATWKDSIAACARIIHCPRRILPRFYWAKTETKDVARYRMLFGVIGETTGEWWMKSRRKSVINRTTMTCVATWFLGLYTWNKIVKPYQNWSYTFWKRIMDWITRYFAVRNLLSHNKLASPRGFEPQFRDTGYELTAAETNLRQIPGAWVSCDISTIFTARIWCPAILK